jgi:peptide/nickel transport system ATP-binding protein
MTAVRSGRVGFRGQDITHLGLRERRSLSSELQVVFQDPYSSLNPTRTIGQTLGESLRHQRNLSGEERSEKIRDTLEKVGMPGDAARRYPGSFSGGQRQRIAIARAIIGGPRLIICDEPTSALDLSVQAQVLNLLVDLQRQFQLGYLFISHDLAVVRHMADEIIVLYRGEIVEQGDAEQVYSSPAHPYTKRLLAAAPVPDPARQRARHRELDELAV